MVMVESEAAVLLDHHFEEADDDDKSLPGFRFHPTDEELVGFYLRRKVEKKRLSIDIIKQVDIYKYDPWDLSKLNTIGIGDKEWYFFCLRGRKYRNSVRPNRVTGSGFWKATGIDKKIYFPAGTNNCIGLKKSLVYYLGSAGKGNKTDWMMHEFRLPPKSSSDEVKDSIYSDEAHEAENWTICRILKRNPSPKKSSTPPWMESRRSYSPTQTDDGSPSSSCLVNTGDQFTTSETDDHPKQDLDRLQVNPSYHVDQINQCSQEQGNINNGVCVVDQQIQDFNQQQLGDFDCGRYLYSTGFDVLPENCEIARTKYECDDSIWDEIGRILEC